MKFNSDLQINVVRMRQGRVQVTVQSKKFPHLRETTIQCGDKDAEHMLRSFAARITRQVEERQAAMRNDGTSPAEKAEALFETI